MKRIVMASLLVAAILSLGLGQAETAPAAGNYAVAGQVTLVDLGADQCVPCRMMAPILKELKTEYAGRAAVVFIDVWKNQDVARDFGIDVIPTQVFFDATGREVYRHTGFMDGPSIRRQFSRMGVKAR